MTNPASDLHIDYVAAPLHVCFVECDDLWERELRRCFKSPSGLRLIHCSLEDDLMQRLPPRSCVLLTLSVANLTAGLRMIHDLAWQGHRVIAVGEADLQDWSLPVQTAGAVGIVTDVCQCDKVARTIEAAAVGQGIIPGNWKTRFVNRLPWSPV